MKLVSYNIQYGKGLDGQVDINRILAAVQDAEIIALQEVDRYWPRSGLSDQVQQLSEGLPDHHWVYGAGIDLHYEDSTPGDNKRRQFGNMILSRFPIETSRHHLLPKRGSTGPVSLQRSALEATIRVFDQKVRIYSVHLTHLSSETRLPQIDHLLHVHEHAEYEGYPVNGDLRGFDWEQGVFDQSVPPYAIIMGDFNCPPDSVEYDQLVGPVCDYGGRIGNPVGFVDAWTEAGNDEQAGFTSDIKDQPARLDYCFVSNGIRHWIKDCWVDTKAVGSDHCPVWVELGIAQH